MAGALTGPRHMVAPGSIGACCIGGTPTPRELVPAETRVGKLDPMGSDIKLNSERKSKSDHKIGLDFSAKAK
jgi:hypothetical protein